MNYNEFTTLLRAELEQIVEKDETVHIQHVPKNNGVILTGVCIVRKGGNITPTIYLDEYYDKCVNGCPMEEVAEAVLKRHRKLQEVDEGEFGFFAEFEKVKSRIVFRIVNYERNKDRLQEMPYEKYLDLAVVFYCHVSVKEGGLAAIPIYKHHLKMWNTDKSEILKWAKRNTPKIFPCELIDMKTVIARTMGQEEMQEFNQILSDENSFIPMYVLSNTFKFNGAGVILYKNVLSDFAKACDGNFFLLPSSVHEVILVPASGSASMEELSRMVREVNESQVEAEEFLADHAYYYDAEQRVLTY